MSNHNHKAPAGEHGIARDVVDLIQVIGQSLNMVILYGVDHKVARNAMHLSHAVLAGFIERHGPIHFSVAEGDLLVNGLSATEASLAGSLAGRLTKLSLLSFVIEPGFSREEQQKLFTVLLSAPTQSGATRNGADLVTALGFEHMQAKTFAYRRVDESVIPVPDEIKPAPEVTPPSPPAPNLDGVLAFLKDDATAEDPRAAEDIRQLASDSEKLAELILRAVEVRARMSNLAEGEPLTDLIVGCIGKVVGQVATDPAIKTQKGRKQVKRSLLVLEKALLERLHAFAGKDAVKAAERVIEAAAEELDVDALTSKFIKSKQAADESAGKLRRVLERTGNDPAQAEELRERLMEQGLTPEGWRELKIDAKAAGSGGEGQGTETGGIKTLALLLARFGETIDQSVSAPPGPPAPETKSLIDDVGRQLSAMAEATEQKIVSLKAMLAGADTARPLPRKLLMETLAEIAQEINQPLAVITGTIAMIRSQRSGPLNETQGEILSMAAASADRMGHLVSCLTRIAGTPASMTPDPVILGAVYAAPATPATGTTHP